MSYTGPKYTIYPYETAQRILNAEAESRLKAYDAVNQFTVDFPFDIAAEINPYTITDDDGYFTLPDETPRMEKSAVYEYVTASRKFYVYSCKKRKTNGKTGHRDFKEVLKQFRDDKFRESMLPDTDPEELPFDDGLNVDDAWSL